MLFSCCEVCLFARILMTHVSRPFTSLPFSVPFLLCAGYLVYGVFVIRVASFSYSSGPLSLSLAKIISKSGEGFLQQQERKRSKRVQRVRDDCRVICCVARAAGSVRSFDASILILHCARGCPTFAVPWRPLSVLPKRRCTTLRQCTACPSHAYPDAWLLDSMAGFT